MFDLASFIKKASYEAEFDLATDSVRTQIVAEKDKVIVRKLYDVEPVLKRAEFFRRLNRECNGFSRQRQFRHIGCIPTIVALDIIKKSQGDIVEQGRMVKEFFQKYSKFASVDSVNGI